MARKQELYVLNNPLEEKTFLYGRSPKQILDAIECCRGGLSMKDVLNERLPLWMRQGASVDDIMQIKDGSVFFQEGWVNLSDEDPFEDIYVAPDFYLKINPESAARFEVAREEMVARTYGELHYLVCKNYLFGGEYFLPPDVAKNMMKIDLEPLKKVGEMQILAAAGIRLPILKPAPIYHQHQDKSGADFYTLVEQTRRRGIN